MALEQDKLAQIPQFFMLELNIGVRFRPDALVVVALQWTMSGGAPARVCSGTGRNPLRTLTVGERALYEVRVCF